MIKVDKANTTMEGTILELMADIGSLLFAFRDLLNEKLPEEMAKHVYQDVLDTATKTREQIREENMKTLKSELDAVKSGDEEAADRIADFFKTLAEALRNENGSKPLLDLDLFKKPVDHKTIEFRKFVWKGKEDE